MLAKSPADGLHQLVGKNGDEQVAVGTAPGLVVDRTQAEFRLQRAEHGFQVGEHRVGAPQGLLVPVDDIGTQAIDVRMVPVISLFCQATAVGGTGCSVGPNSAQNMSEPSRAWSRRVACTRWTPTPGWSMCCNGS